MGRDYGEENNMKLTETEKAVDALIKERRQLGRDRYGEGISYKQSDDIINWVTQAIEECADQLNYLVSLKLRLQYEQKRKV